MIPNITTDIIRDKILSLGLPVEVNIEELVMRVYIHNEVVLHGVDRMNTEVNAIKKNNTMNVPTPIPSTSVCSIDTIRDNKD